MVTSPLPAWSGLTASATIMTPGKMRLQPKYDRWQTQLWDFYDRLGEFEAGVAWKANSLSRVRLLAAELQPSGQEPIPIESGFAADAVERLAGGIGGQAQLMKQSTIHLSVPGEGWMVGEVDRSEDGEQAFSTELGSFLPADENWQVYSADEIRLSPGTDERGHRHYDVKEGDDNSDWRPIDRDSIVVRFWDPHPRFKWRADSSGRHALSDLAELDAINKRFLATLWSRVALNGIMLYDRKRLGMPLKPPPQDGTVATDPLADRFVAVAGRAMDDVLSPEALLPLPFGFDIDDPTDVDPSMLIQFIKMSEGIDDKLMNARDGSIRKLATTLDMPAEILLGMSGLNHWGAWQIEESGIKIHVAPMAELICHSLTTGFLVPTLKAGGQPLRGENGGRIVVWYDPSEITQRPDKSDKAVVLNDRGLVNDHATRREAGFDEEDAPTQQELDFMVARRQALGGTGTGVAPTVPVDEDADANLQNQELPGTDRDTPEDAEPDSGVPELAMSLNGGGRR